MPIKHRPKGPGGGQFAPGEQCEQIESDEPLEVADSEPRRRCKFWKCRRFVADSVLTTRIRYWDGQSLEILLCPRCANRAVGMPPQD